MKTATCSIVQKAIQENRLRVYADGRIEGKTAHANSVWRPRALEEVCGPHQRKPYYRITFTCGGIRYRCLAHRAVWFALAGDIPHGMQINHKDGDKSNNELDNLELMTPSQNIQHGVDNGLIPVHHAKNRSLSDTQVNMVHSLHKKQWTGVRIAEYIGTNTNTVSRILSGTSYQAPTS